MHSGIFGSVRDVVEYFNAGVPQDSNAAAAGNLSPLFTNPRGADEPGGLGLSDKDVDALVDFLENALYDPAFARFNANAPTDSFELNERDLTYSTNRTDLAALGAVDGLMPSGLCGSNDDPLSRRDRGLEFEDVTSRAALTVDRIERDASGAIETQHVTVTNIGSAPVDTHLLVCFATLPAGVEVLDAEGTTRNAPAGGMPYMREFVPNGVIEPGASMQFAIRFRTASPAPVHYAVDFLSGQGKP